MIVTEWKDFGTDAQFYTQDGFEKEIDDTFEAACFHDTNDVPNYIWTKNHVIVIKNNTRMINDVSFVKIPRHPGVMK